MIEVSLTGLAAGAVAAAMVLVFFFSWISRWSNGNAERRSLRRRMSCQICQYVYEDPGARTTGQCPNCGAINEKGRSRSLG